MPATHRIPAESHSTHSEKQRAFFLKNEIRAGFLFLFSFLNNNILILRTKKIILILITADFVEIYSL
jgi:hypothetical protein